MPTNFESIVASEHHSICYAYFTSKFFKTFLYSIIYPNETPIILPYPNTNHFIP